MLYYLFEYLNEMDVPGAGVFQYITFRAAASVFVSLLISMVSVSYTHLTLPTICSL